MPSVLYPNLFLVRFGTRSESGEDRERGNGGIPSSVLRLRAVVLMLRVAVLRLRAAGNGSERSSSLKRTVQRYLVGEFKLSAYRHAAGETGYPAVLSHQRSELSSEIHSGCLSLDR